MLMKVRDMGARAGTEAGPYAWGRWLLIKCVYKKWAVCVGAALCGRPRDREGVNEGARFGDTGGDGAPPLRDGTGYVDEGAGYGGTGRHGGRPLRMGAVVVNKVCL